MGNTQDKIIQIMTDSSDEPGEFYIYGLSESGKLYGLQVETEEVKPEGTTMSYFKVKSRQWVFLLDNPNI